LRITPKGVNTSIATAVSPAMAKFIWSYMSASSPLALTVDANASYLSFSDIASSGTPGNYTLTGAVAAFGKHVPTGTVSFLDTDSGNAVVGTAALDPTTLGFILLPAPSSPATVGLRPQKYSIGRFQQ
jgi:hypothetical protein